MTWTLVHESALLETSGSQAHIDFWYYFFDTFLPTRGWTTTINGPFNSSQNYWLCRKQTTDGYGNPILWNFLCELEWSSQDGIMYHAKSDDTTPITTDKTPDMSNSNFSGLLGKNDYLQIWQSNAPGGFLVKWRTTAADGIVSFQPPDSWIMQNQEYLLDGTNAFYYWLGDDSGASTNPFNIRDKISGASTSYYEAWYALPTCGTYGDGVPFYTNQITACTSTSLGSAWATQINTVSDEALMVYWNNSATYLYCNYRSTLIEGKYYIECYSTSNSLLLDTGTVDPSSVPAGTLSLQETPLPCVKLGLS